MNRLLLFLCLSSPVLAQSLRPAAFVATDPSGNYRYVSVDVSGALVTTGSALNMSVLGYVMPTLVYGLAPDGSYKPINVDSSGALKTTGSTGVSSTSSGPSNITVTVGTSAIAANTCSAVLSTAMSGVLTNSTFVFTPSGDINTVTGWGSTGGLVILPWPTVDTLNYRICNQTSASITPSTSVTFNVSAR